MATRRALVLGATGMVGRPLALELKQQGWDVIGAARLSNPEKAQPLKDAGIQVIQYNVTDDDPAKLPDVDVVFLEVWDPGKPKLIWPINFYGIGKVVQHYAGKADFINGCTINVYGDQPGQPSEDDAPKPNSDYGRSRYAQERLIDFFCHQSGSKCVHVRYAHSNTAEQGMVRRIADFVLAEKPLNDKPDAKLQVIAIEDFIRVTIGAVDHLASPSATVNCCHPRVWTYRELAEELQSRLGRGKALFKTESGGEEKSAYADASRMIEWFGEPSVPIDDVLDRVVQNLQ